MIKPFKYFIILIITLIPLILKAQYTPNDRDLVETTFNRTFSNDIISKYLDSNDPIKVNAGLLSVSQSGDKSFINEIIKLDFLNNAEYICFALGQLGADSLSSAFLYQELSDPNLPVNFRPYILKAIGKTGSKKTLELLIRDYFSNDYLLYDGISIALFDFYSREIRDDINFENILRKELTGKDIPLQRKIDAAFSAYRTNQSDNFKDFIAKELDNFSDEYFSNTDKNILVQYYLENLRKSKYFPDNSTLFRKLVNSNSSLIRIEAAKSLVYYNYEDKDDLSDYLSLLDDDNPNVSRQAAISIKKIDIPSELMPELKKEITGIIQENELPDNTKGELLISDITIFPESFSDIIKTFNSKVKNEFLFRAASMFTSSDSAFNYLINNYKDNSLKDKINILGYLINFQSSFRNNDKLKKIFVDALNSDSPALISIASDGVDSSFINNNSNELKRIVSNQTIRLLNNPDFIESLISLNGLSAKLSNDIYTQNLQNLSNSDIYAIRSFAKDKLNIPIEENQNTDTLFTHIWENSFRYKHASVVTEKGTFSIIFLPEYAPVTVGNFCYLSNINFFDNITFHRVVPGFVIQGGDPTGTGWGGPGYAIVSEFSQLHYSPGTVGMASAGKDTEGSQWFVTIGDFPHLDRKYTIFGFVNDGMSVVNTIDQNDKIITIKLTH